jgi:hypothetical protein
MEAAGVMTRTQPGLFRPSLSLYLRSCGLMPAQAALPGVIRHEAWRLAHDPESGYRFSEKIMRQKEVKAR